MHNGSNEGSHSMCRIICAILVHSGTQPRQKLHNLGTLKPAESQGVQPVSPENLPNIS
jgi:hypothetical protein